MPRNTADVVDHEHDVNAPANDHDHEAQALAAINASWQDEAERTDVMQPRHLLAHALFGRESEFEQLPTTQLPNVPPRAADDPCWDDEREETFAVDFERLAPWHVPEVTSAFPEEEQTEYFERTADFQLLDSRFVAEYTDRHPSLVAPSPAPVAPAAAEPRPVPAARTSNLRPLKKRIGSETIPGRGRSVAPAEPERPSQPVAATPITRSSRVPAHTGRTSRVPSAETQPLRPSRVSRPNYAPAAATSLEYADTVAQDYAVAVSSAFATVPEAHAAALPASHYPAASSGTYARSTASQRLTPVPMTTTYDADLRNLRRRSSSPAWLWTVASALAAVALVLAVRAWSSGTFSVPLMEQPAAAAAVETTVHAISREETGFAITSQPEGARISVDGRATGFVTPARVKRLTPGLHSVQLELAGHFDTTLPAVLQDGATLELAAVQMRPREATPEPATVAATAAAAPQLTAAVPKHVPRARQERRARKRGVTRNAPMPVLEEEREAEPAPAVAEAEGEGTLRINSRPWARIMIDDKFVGNTPQRSLRVAAGSHSVRLVNEPMNMSKSFRIDVRGGETITRVEILQEESGQSSNTPSTSGQTLAKWNPSGL